MLILIISFCDWYRWGWSKCIGYADSKLREKHIRKYGRSALCIAVSRLICHLHRESLKFFFLPFTSVFNNSDHLSSDSTWHWHTSTFSRLSSLDNPSIRLSEWICQFPTWKRRCCFQILSAKMTWRYIKSVIVYFLVLLSSFRLHHNQLWHVTCHGNLPLLLSFAWPLLQPATKTVASVDGLCLPSVPRNNNLLIAQPNKYRIREHTHTHTNAHPHHQLLRLVPLGVVQMYWLCWFQATRKTYQKI